MNREQMEAWLTLEGWVFFSGPELNDYAFNEKEYWEQCIGKTTYSLAEAGLEHFHKPGYAKPLSEAPFEFISTLTDILSTRDCSSSE